MRAVCVIDDDPAVRKGVANLLKSAGYHPVCFASGESFLSSPWKTQAACLVLDVCMPGMSGLDVQRQIRAEGSPLPVICMSADASEQNVAPALREGAHAFLSKPFSAERLLAAVAGALGEQP